jgi:hypothetical protein
MNAFLTRVAAAIAFGGLFAVPAIAVPVTHDFTVTALTGPLAGHTANGTFTYDSSIATPFAALDQAGLLTGLSLTWDGIAYNATTANSADLIFDGSGNLVDIAFGTHCSAGSCSLPPGQEGWMVTGPYNGGLLVYSDVLSADGGHGNFTWDPTAEVPEPATLALFAVGLAGAAARRYRRNPYKE